MDRPGPEGIHVSFLPKKQEGEVQFFHFAIWMEDVKENQPFCGFVVPQTYVFDPDTVVRRALCFFLREEPAAYKGLGGREGFRL